MTEGEARVSSDPLTAPMPDFGAEPPRRSLLARLRHPFGKSAAPPDAFGQAASDDPFAFDDGQEANFRRRRRIMGIVLVLLVIGIAAGATAYVMFVPDTPEPAEVASSDSGLRVVQPMPPEPGPESLGRALMAPPGTDNPDAARRAEGLGAPVPAAPTAPTEAKPAPLPKVAMPSQPQPRIDREAVSKPPRYADLPRNPPATAKALPPAPSSDLQRRTATGLTVPTVSSDGRRPWQAYARPFTGAPDAPRIAVVIAGLGLMTDATSAAIEATPGDVTLAFDAAAPQLPDRLAAARRAGHETLIEIGLQSRDFPAVDPGPDGLLSGLSAGENQARLERSLSQGAGYVGVLARGGDDFAATPAQASALLGALRRMGLALVSSAAIEAGGAMPPQAHTDVVIPASSFREEIAAKLREAEAIAKARGRAVVTVSEPTPLALAALTPWIGGLKGRGFEIAPVSAVVKE
jgi:hypothetical protein